MSNQEKEGEEEELGHFGVLEIGDRRQGVDRRLGTTLPSAEIHISIERSYIEINIRTFRGWLFLAQYSRAPSLRKFRNPDMKQ